MSTANEDIQTASDHGKWEFIRSDVRATGGIEQAGC